MVSTADRYLQPGHGTALCAGGCWSSCTCTAGFESTLNQSTARRQAGGQRALHSHVYRNDGDSDVLEINGISIFRFILQPNSRRT